MFGNIFKRVSHEDAEARALKSLASKVPLDERLIVEKKLCEYKAFGYDNWTLGCPGAVIPQDMSEYYYARGSYVGYSYDEACLIIHHEESKMKTELEKNQHKRKEDEMICDRCKAVLGYEEGTFMIENGTQKCVCSLCRDEMRQANIASDVGPNMRDINDAEDVEVHISDDGRLWVNTENGCILRISNIKNMSLLDGRIVQ